MVAQSEPRIRIHAHGLADQALALGAARAECLLGQLAEAAPLLFGLVLRTHLPAKREALLVLPHHIGEKEISHHSLPGSGSCPG